jgi:hypothetical protein
MFKTLRDKMTLSGISVLSIGVTLLVFTFISAYGFLTQSLSIVSSADLVQTFGEALAPLITACIRLMYLGIMGWVASLLTIRGITILTHTPQPPPTIPQQPSNTRPIQRPQAQSQKLKNKKTVEEKPKQEEEPKEPEVVTIPPEPITEPQLSNT